jgi:hypothetical protein
VVRYDVNWRNPLHLDGFEAEVLEIRIGGGGRATLRDLKVDKLVIHQGGGSRIEADGVAEVVEARIGGGSRFEAYGLESAKVVAKVSGGSRAYVLAEGQFDVTVSGSATVAYRGEPTHFRKHVSSHSTLKFDPPRPQLSDEERRRLESLQRTLQMRMTFEAQERVARGH